MTSEGSAAGHASPASYLLEARGICKRFSGTAALKMVNFRVKTDEVHALMGENGAGKSTMMKNLAGSCVPDQGNWQIGELPRNAHLRFGRRGSQTPSKTFNATDSVRVGGTGRPLGR